MTAPALCLPDWPAIPGVRAAYSLRSGGVSPAPWDSLNLGNHVGDEPERVQRNRQIFAGQLGALCPPGATAPRPVFLQQVHGTAVLELPVPPSSSTAGAPCADACLTAEPGWACTIMVADCLPVLLAHRPSGVVAAAHAGWRGLAAGVLEQLWRSLCALARQRMGALAGSDVALAAQTQAWLGPCIGPQAFEVGDEVRQAFVRQHAWAQAYFVPHARGKWQADLAALARGRLQALGIAALHGNDSSLPWCTVSDPLRFFSHRRDAAHFGSTGRMAVAIWRV